MLQREQMSTVISSVDGSAFQDPNGKKKLDPWPDVVTTIYRLKQKSHYGCHRLIKNLTKQIQNANFSLEE